MMRKPFEVVALFVFFLKALSCDAQTDVPGVTELTTPITPEPTPIPTPYPTAKPTLHPTLQPTPKPTCEPTFPPSPNPTPQPTPEPTFLPSTPEPTTAPTTLSPTTSPTQAPTTSAPTTEAPSVHPTTLPPSAAPTTSAPTDSPTGTPITLAPTTVAPSVAPTTSIPTAVPTTRVPPGSPTDTPTIAPSFSPTAFVLVPVPPINLTNSTVVQDRCREIIESSNNVAKLASFWEPNITATPLYYSSPEGGFAIQGFAPQYFLSQTITAVTTTTPIDIAGTTCSMNLHSQEDDCKIRRSLMELNKNGRLVSWMNAYDDNATCNRTSAAVMPSTADEMTRCACATAFEAVFPSCGQSLNSLLTMVKNTFVPKTSTLAFPAGNINTTVTNFTKKAWPVVELFMSKLNPFQMPLTVTITSPMDVTGSVCSFDQELQVNFLVNCSTPLVAKGRVIMEMQGNLIAQLLSQFDNTTFWGGIEQCAMKLEADKKAKKAAKKQAKKQKKQEKKAKKQKEKAKKKREKEEAKKKKKEEKEKKSKKKDNDKVTSDSLFMSWMGGLVESIYMRIDKFESVHTGLLVAIILLAAAFTMRRSNPQRRGYQELSDVEPMSFQV